MSLLQMPFLSPRFALRTLVSVLTGIRTTQERYQQERERKRKIEFRESGQTENDRKTEKCNIQTKFVFSFRKLSRRENLFQNGVWLTNVVVYELASGVVNLKILFSTRVRRVMCNGEEQKQVLTPTSGDFSRLETRHRRKQVERER